MLSTDDIECLAVGTGLLGCGGGGDPNIGRHIALQQLALGRTIKVLNPLRSEYTCACIKHAYDLNLSSKLQCKPLLFFYIHVVLLG